MNMDQDQDAWIDSVLTQSGHTPAGVEGSAPEPEPGVDPAGQSDVQAVAPSHEQASADSSTVADSTADTLAPDPTEARFAAMQAQLDEASRKAAVLDQIEQAARQQVVQQQRQAQAAEWQKQIEAAAELSPEMQQRESRRIMAEIEQAQAAQYQPQLQQAHSDVEQTAAVATAFFHAIQNNPQIPEAVKQQVIADSRYLANLPTPEAQKQTLDRDRRIAESAVAAAKAEWEKQQTKTIATRANQRIEQGTDLVGVAAGSAGDGDDGSVDWLVDRVFANRR